MKHNLKKYNEIIQMNIFSLCMQTYFIVLFFLDPVFYNSFYWCSFAIIIIIQDFALREERNISKNENKRYNNLQKEF